MAYASGITKYLKKVLWDLVAARTLKVALYTDGASNLDANTDPASPLVYGTTNEISSSGTGYTAGGYALASIANSASGNAYQITAADVVTGSGTLAAGSYEAMIYDTADSNRAIAICPVTVTTGSVAGTMTFDIPADALKIS